MLHATCMQGSQGDSQLLVVRSQIANLTPGFSFGHNLCFRCPNGSCKPILDIYVLIAFQWYGELLEPLGFDPCNHSLNIGESIGTPTPNMGVHLGVWGFFPSHSFALLGVWECDSWAYSWLTPLQALCLGHEPKAKITTPLLIIMQLFIERLLSTLVTITLLSLIAIAITIDLMWSDFNLVIATLIQLGTIDLTPNLM
jgi:hypothetical protein